MQIVKFLVQAVIVLAGSLGALWALGPRVYVIIAICMTLILFALIITSDARTATSDNPDPVVHLQPMPWGVWTLLSALLGITLGAFWPCLPIVLAAKKLSARVAADRAAAEYDEPL